MLSDDIFSFPGYVNVVVSNTWIIQYHENKGFGWWFQMWYFYGWNEWRGKINFHTAVGKNRNEMLSMAHENVAFFPSPLPSKRVHYLLKMLFFPSSAENTIRARDEPEKKNMNYIKFMTIQD